ncbi:MAG: GNAT family N-acetyltransferase [Bacteroidota bacterium]
MEIELIEIQANEKQELKTMLSEYLKEILAPRTENIEGEVDYPYFDSYWVEPTRTPLKIKWKNKIVGFALINEWIVCKEFNAQKNIAEFYVKQEYRRRGIGKNVAVHLFKRYRGKWEIRQLSTNLKAVKFWRRVIGEFTQGNYKEIEQKVLNRFETIQLFES